MPSSFLLDASLEETLCRVLKIDPAEWRATKALWESGTAWTIHHIPKKNGVRIIHAPSDPLKLVLRSVLKLFLQCIPVHMAVHGAHPGTSIVTNARAHVGDKAFYFLDLKDAFPSTNRKRCASVLGPRLATHLADATDLSEKDSKRLAETLIDLLIVDDVLPQGFPTSPAVLNVVLGAVDRVLSQLLRAESEKEGVVYRYTRFVDDLTISTDAPEISKKLRQSIRRAITHDGWTIQGTKVHYFGDAEEGDEERTTRNPEVTGIIPNPDGRLTIPRPRLNKFRAILHDLLTASTQRLEGDAEALGKLQAQFDLFRELCKKRKVWIQPNLTLQEWCGNDWPLSPRERQIIVGIVGFVGMVYDQQLPSIIRKPYNEAKVRFGIGLRDMAGINGYNLDTEIC
ncbi:RNA-directed DNA polymerase [Candidatus Uhrbacteria bacterium]|nr:RNA-directed DNA polymerase [Candidatus Uhrbacteria bacterium]